jgi:hypothetical protein
MERQRRLKVFFQVGIALFSVIVTLFAAYSQYVSARVGAVRFEEAAYRTTEATQAVVELRERLEKLESLLAQISAVPTNGALAPKDLQELTSRLDRVEESTIGLRQAINPLKPEEVITIARLTDKVSDLREDFEQLNKSVERDFDSFSGSVQRELQASSSSTNLILVVLIPLVLNFLYTVWKDLRSKDEGKSDRKGSPNPSVATDG